MHKSEYSYKDQDQTISLGMNQHKARVSQST